jgi:hypothetical protein
MNVCVYICMYVYMYVCVCVGVSVYVCTYYSRNCLDLSVQCPNNRYSRKKISKPLHYTEVQFALLQRTTLNLLSDCYQLVNFSGGTTNSHVLTC